MADQTEKLKAQIDSLRRGTGPKQRLGYRNTRVDYAVHDGKGNWEVATKPGKRATPKYVK